MPRVLTLEGDGAGRGAAYGEGARDLIVEAAARWESELGERAEDVLHDLVDASGFAEAVRRLDPSLAEEVEGIARGSGVDRRRVWALNLLDESWWVARGLRGRGLAAGGCSVLGVAAGGDNAPLIAQNMDLPVWVDGLEVLL